MGVGKTSVGRVLAKRLSRQFVDLDETIAASERTEIAALIVRRGESVFRQLEKDALARQLLDGKNKVIALGGGTLLDARLRADTRKRGSVICLNASVETLLKRLEGTRNRPLLDADNLEASLAEILASRRESYGDVDVQINTDQQSIEAVVDRLNTEIALMETA